MKRLLILLFITVACGAQVPQTPNLKLNLPPQGIPNWGTLLNQNFTTLDTVVGGLQRSYAGTWVAATLYQMSSIVNWNGYSYISLVANNLNQQPGLAPAAWAPIGFTSGPMIAPLTIQPPSGTAASLILKSTATSPSIQYQNLSAGTDLKDWATGTTADGTYHLSISNDAQTAGGDVMTCTRAGAVAGVCTFPGGLAAPNLPVVSGTSGDVQFNNAGALGTDTGNFYYDPANKALHVPRFFDWNDPLAQCAIYRGQINVKDCGALGNNSNDDSVGIQAALNSPSAVNGTVYIPDGTYLITRTITVPANVTLTCASSNTVIEFTPGGGYAGGIGVSLAGNNIHISNCNLQKAPGNTMGYMLNLAVADQHVFIDKVVIGPTGPTGTAQIGMNQVYDVWVRDVQLLGQDGTYNLVAHPAAGQWQPVQGLHVLNGKFTGAGAAPDGSGSALINIACFDCFESDIRGNFVNQGGGIAAPYTVAGYGIMIYRFSGASTFQPSAITSLGSGKFQATVPVGSLTYTADEHFFAHLATYQGGTGVLNGMFPAVETSPTTLTFTNTNAGADYTGAAPAPTPIVSVTVTGNIAFVEVAPNMLPPANPNGQVVYMNFTVAGINGGTGLNGTFGGYVADGTHLQYACVGCSATGASVSGATLLSGFNGSYAPIHDHVDNNTVMNAGGNCFYLQTVYDTEVSGNIAINCDILMARVSLPPAGLAINGSVNSSFTNNIINGSGKDGISVNNSVNTVVTGGAIQNVAGYGVSVGATNQAGEIQIPTIMNASYGILITANTNGIAYNSVNTSQMKFGRTNITNTPGACISVNQSKASDLSFSDVTCNEGAQRTFCYLSDSSVTNTAISNIKCVNAFIQTGDIGLKVNGYSFYAMPAHEAVDLTTGAADQQWTAGKIDSTFGGFKAQAQVKNITVQHSSFTNQTGVDATDGSPAAITGTVTSGSNTITGLPNCNSVQANAIVEDSAGSNAIPAATLIGTCSGTSATMVDASGNPVNATATATESINFYNVYFNGLHWWQNDVKGACPSSTQAFLFWASYAVDVQGGSIGCFAQTNSLIDFRGASGMLGANSIVGMNITTGANGLQASGLSRNLTVSGNAFSGQSTRSYVDVTTNSGNVFAGNTFTTAHNVTNPNAIHRVNLTGVSASIGGAALAINACATGTASVLGAVPSMRATADPVTDPNTTATSLQYTWRAKVTATNQVTVYVCAVQAGTPAASTFNVRVQ